MTTIAYRDGVMAADSLMVSADCRVGGTQKVFKIHGHLVSISGTLRCCITFKDWLQVSLKGGKLEKAPDFLDGDKDASMHAYVVTPKGKIFKYEDKGMPWPVDAPFVASGSGRDYALAAMACGKSPKEAIKIAAQFDIYSGGAIQSVRL